QVILNLVNNAVKFTKEGCVCLSVQYEKKSEREIMLKVSVRDTGIGIKQEDMGRLFQSFQQVDSKRNRNIEGTGLGLAISKQLVTLMNGEIGVTSEYGKGSCFFFEIPQLVLDITPSVEAETEQKAVKTAGLLCDNEYVLRHMKKMLKELQMECISVQNSVELEALEAAEFLFMESACYSGRIQEYLETHPQVTGVLLAGFKEQLSIDLENVLAVRKPLYILELAKILVHEDLYADEDDLEEEDFGFIAPDADVLIVDDNEVNLIVAEGIISPLQMRVDKAVSGKQAIEMIEKKHYDLILMDHMMPELDGIETTRIIRRFHEDYDDVPIIALTANVMEEVRARFLVEGMNDFVAKPIESRVLVSKIKQWLPAKKQQRLESREKGKARKQEQAAKRVVIPQLDIDHALQLLGSEELFWQVLKEYVRTIPKKARTIEQYLKAEDWKSYTIETHALKSSSRQIGAMELSELAAQIEQAGKNNDVEFIHAHHRELLERYRAYELILAKYIEDPEEEKKPKTVYDAEKVLEYLDSMQDAVDNLEMDDMDRIVGLLDQIILKDMEAQCLKKMKEAVEELDVENCEEIIKVWRRLIHL
ncbi:MAG: response regulator, partial [Acetatifactor sp.]|nr:response regulator [Acetatifactor sp.]